MLISSRQALRPVLSPGFCEDCLVSEVHRHSATGHNGPDGSVVLWNTPLNAGEITGYEINCKTNSTCRTVLGQ